MIRLTAVFALLLTACASLAGRDRDNTPELRAATGFEMTPAPSDDPLEDLVPLPVAPAPPPVETPAASVEPDAAAPAAKKPPPPAAVATCDGKSTPCPLQKFMRGVMLAAKSDPSALQAAFSRVANIGPPALGNWRAIAQRGAAAAKDGDVPEAKAQCNACHAAYKEQYKAQFRSRPAG